MNITLRDYLYLVSDEQKICIIKRPYISTNSFYNNEFECIPLNDAGDYKLSLKKVTYLMINQYLDKKVQAVYAENDCMHISILEALNGLNEVDN